ncbi:oxidoreductase [Thozetella sp. PMI_491]|nr:oxidoreductase [Thozetella sp. PMI_491]
MITRSEVEQHRSRQSCWVIINDHVYDVTEFVDEHPGGANVILRYAGKDATEAFEPLHPSDTLERHLQPSQMLGPVTGLSATKSDAKTSEPIETSALQQSKKIRLSSIISLDDFESGAAKVLDPRQYAFFATGAEDEHALKRNRESWNSVRFRPRVLRPIDQIDLSCTLLGTNFAAPFFISPAGGGKLANPKGEVLLTKAAGKHGVLHWVCNNAGCTKEQMADTRAPNQTLFWQVYVKADLKASEREVREAITLGYKAFALTVDAIRPGKRETDIRVSLAEDEAAAADAEDEEENSGSFARAPTVKRPPVWSSFDWISAIKWMRNLTDLPIAVKGIQCWEDAALCMQHGAHPWLSNHGGRQLDGAPSAVDTLLEIRANCPEVFEKCEVVVDGGIRRGSDVIKALALGAKGVGLGRSFLYALVLGEPGISKAIRILQHEMETTMALLGVSSLRQLSQSYVSPYASIRSVR